MLSITAVRHGALEGTAAGHVTSGRYAEAAKVYAQLVSSTPDNPALRLVRRSPFGIVSSPKPAPHSRS